MGSKLIEKWQRKLVKPIALVADDAATHHSDNIHEAEGGYVEKLPQTFAARLVELRPKFSPVDCFGVLRQREEQRGRSIVGKE